MDKYVLLGVVLAGMISQGCGSTLEQLQSSSGQAMGPNPGRAFFLRRTAGATEVIICDARQSAVYCYPSNAPSGGTGGTTP
jgi:hypothetical protein